MEDDAPRWKGCSLGEPRRLQSREQGEPGGVAPTSSLCTWHAKLGGGSDLLKGSQRASRRRVSQMSCLTPQSPSPLLSYFEFLSPEGASLHALRLASPPPPPPIPPLQSLPAPQAHLLQEPSGTAAPELSLLRSPIASRGRDDFQFGDMALSGSWHGLGNHK